MGVLVGIYWLSDVGNAEGHCFGIDAYPPVTYDLLDLADESTFVTVMSCLSDMQTDRCKVHEL